jgi:hypothetical protein
MLRVIDFIFKVFITVNKMESLGEQNAKIKRGTPLTVTEALRSLNTNK